ncbi:hypothetical protein [Paracoccus sp. (in: a-proteobacteria)]|uniref:hypothetical protein n=1 Tax=Paracoccus sp. TaxID=267 RepID=UPI00289F60EA|nr:hypothetical protein [Paracoccus sp. (in: a-proteobacteria)]
MRRQIRKFFVNFSKLLTAFSFYRLRGQDLIYFQYIYPTVIVGASVLAYKLVSDGYVIVNLRAMVASATTLMGVLIGFYIAALAAVTSFPNAGLDNVMSGEAPKIRELVHGNLVPLTRRRFLSTLLGYCAFISIFIFVIGSISAASDLALETPEKVRYIFRIVWWGSYAWLLASLLVVTMLCLHYLIERMHRD